MERNGQALSQVEDQFTLQQTLNAEDICVNACGPMTVVDETIKAQHLAKAPGIPETLVTVTQKDTHCGACGYNHTAINVTADEA